MLRKAFLFVIILLSWPFAGRAQWSLKNNLLYDAALTPNLGVEARFSQKWTGALNLGFSPFETGTNSTRRWRHLLVMPEARYWFCEAYSHHFLSANAVYSHFNASRLDLPIYGTDDYRYQGDFVGAGVSYGYAIPIGKNKHWNIEFEIGADLCYAWYDKYNCEHCGGLIGPGHKWFVLPKAAVSLAWVLPSKHFNKERAHACDEEEPVVLPPAQPEPAPAPAFEPVFAFVEDNTGRAGELQKNNPILSHISKYQPYDDTRILRKESNALYVFFPVNQGELQPAFRDNEGVLDRIVDITRQVLADTISTVKKIQIIGLASIEGSVDNNCKLGEERGLALKSYIQEHVPTPDSLYEVANGCEAWSEFRDQIKDISLMKAGQKVEVLPGMPAAATNAALTSEVLAGVSEEELAEILRIIDEESNLNRREQLIRQLHGGRTWNFLRQNILADQRNSGYLRIYFDYVPDAAAKAINRATALMKENKFQEALPILETVKGDSRAWNALGVALYKAGQKEQALAYFRRAAAEGNQQAKRNLEGLKDR